MSTRTDMMKSICHRPSPARWIVRTPPVLDMPVLHPLPHLDADVDALGKALVQAQETLLAVANLIDVRRRGSVLHRQEHVSDRRQLIGEIPVRRALRCSRGDPPSPASSPHRRLSILAWTTSMPPSPNEKGRDITPRPLPSRSQPGLQLRPVLLDDARIDRRQRRLSGGGCGIDELLEDDVGQQLAARRRARTLRAPSAPRGRAIRRRRRAPAPSGRRCHGGNRCRSSPESCRSRPQRSPAATSSVDGP